MAAVLALSVAPVHAGDGGVSMSGPTMFTQQDGAALFQATCQGCHMANAQGASGAGVYPALAKNVRLAAVAYPLFTVMKGRKGMPSFASYLTDAQVAAVVDYVRTHFGNAYRDKVPLELVRRARAAP